MQASIAAILPCYKSGAHVLAVIGRIGPEVSMIICVDDACPQKTGDLIERQATDPRVRVVRLPKNRGVGGAVCRGYEEALMLGADICVKIDSDGQMDPALLPYFVKPIVEGRTDYTKGNRFFNLEDVRSMPFLRLVGNAGLSFLSKLSSGYWAVFDPTNGYTAIHARVIQRLPLNKIAPRYFFESDILFRLGALRARVDDIPMTAIYGDETSGLSALKSIGPFFIRNLFNFLKRIFYNYILRNFSAGSLYLLVSIPLIVWGLFGAAMLLSRALDGGAAATSGQVMLAALPLLFGAQLALAFLQYDVESAPTQSLHPHLPDLRAVIDELKTTPPTGAPTRGDPNFVSTSTGFARSDQTIENNASCRRSNARISGDSIMRQAIIGVGIVLVVAGIVLQQLKKSAPGSVRATEPVQTLISTAPNIAEENKNPCELAVGNEITFGVASECNELLLSGWSEVETASVWSNGPNVELELRFAVPPPAGASIRLKVLPFLADGKIPQQKISASVDGVSVGEWVFNENTYQNIIFSANNVFKDNNSIKLKLSISDSASPASFNLSGDGRALGISLIGIYMADQPNSE